jgi:hypothetical protein
MYAALHLIARAFRAGPLTAETSAFQRLLLADGVDGVAAGYRLLELAC